jgi:hypothetical protein
LFTVSDHPLIDPQYLLGRAQEFRAHADSVGNDASKRLMLSLAESYERLARRAEEGSATPGGA